MRGLRLPCLLTGEGDLAGETLGLPPPWLLTGEGDLAGETLGLAPPWLLTGEGELAGETLGATGGLLLRVRGMELLAALLSIFVRISVNMKKKIV